MPKRTTSMPRNSPVTSICGRRTCGISHVGIRPPRRSQVAITESARVRPLPLYPTMSSPSWTISKPQAQTDTSKYQISERQNQEAEVYVLIDIPTCSPCDLPLAHPLMTLIRQAGELVLKLGRSEAFSVLPSQRDQEGRCTPG